jgi:3-dehydroquinate dehydratase, type I
MIRLGKKLIGQGTRPLICSPLVGQTKEKIMGQLEQVILKQPDVIEWRADFFDPVDDTAQVLDVAETVKKAIGLKPLIFTIRSIREGGHPIPLTDREAIELNAEVCRRTATEYVDCELSNAVDDIRYLHGVAAENGKMIIGSFHDFNMTPDREILLNKIITAEQFGLEVAKIAVMPQSLKDVLTLLGVTLEARERVRIPLITMSMGKHGVISRMVGGLFGSSLSFAVGAMSSAPGQIPIEDLKTVLDIIDKVRGSNGDE